MNFIDRWKIYQFHRHQQRAFPEEPARALGWKDTRSQLERFAVMAQAVDFERRSVLDLGCGFADFLIFLQRQTRVKYYIGLDQQRSFINAAQRRALATEHEFRCCDFSAIDLPAVDVVVASGSLNYRSRETGYLVAMINKMYQAARRDVVFNLLDIDKVPESQLLQGYKKSGVVRFCRALCDDVSCIDDYCDHDFTIIMHKKTSSL